MKRWLTACLIVILLASSILVKPYPAAAQNNEQAVVIVNGTAFPQDAIYTFDNEVYVEVGSFSAATGYQFLFDDLHQSVAINDHSIYVIIRNKKPYASLKLLSEAVNASLFQYDAQAGTYTVTAEPEARAANPGNVMYNFLKEPFSVIGNKDLVLIYNAVPSGGVFRDALHIHPLVGESGRNQAVFPVDLTPVPQNATVLLDFYVGFIDGAKPLGVNFSVFVNDQQVFDQTTKDVRWNHRIVDISAWAGQKVDIKFTTVGDPAPDYGWAVYGEPTLVIAGHDVASSDWQQFAAGTDSGWTATGSFSRENGVLTVNGPFKLETGRTNGISGYLEITGDTANPPRLSVETSAITNGQAKPPKQVEAVLVAAANDKYRYLVPFDVSGELDESANIGSSFKLSLQSDSPFTITNISLYRNEGAPTLTSVSDMQRKHFTGQDITFNASILNKGIGIISAYDQMEVELAYNGQTQRKPIHRLDPQQTADLQWNLGQLDADAYPVTISLLAGGTSTLLKSVELVVEPGYDIAQPDASKITIIESDQLALAMYKKSGKVDEGFLYKKSSGTYKLMGSLPLGRLWLDGKEEVLLDQLTLSDVQGSKAVLNKKLLEGDVTITWKVNHDRVQMIHEFKSKKKQRLKAFDGPTLLAGQGSFGGNKDSAIFPGLDFLDGEPSSNTFVAMPPFHERSVPHPYKVTIPAISLAHEGDIVTYSWDTQQPWLIGEKYPSIRFDSPNRNGKDNTLIGMFAPSIPDWTNENKPFALKAYPLEQDDLITLQAEIRLSVGTHASDGIYDYVKERGLPDLPDNPRNTESNFKLMLRGLEREMQGPEGWIYFLGVMNSPSVELGFLHNLEYMKSLFNETDATRAQDILNTVYKPAPYVDWSYADAYWLRQPKDIVDDWFRAAIRTGTDLGASQKENGNWDFVPDRTTAPFGKLGDQVMGITAPNTLRALKAARLTGSEQYWQVAEKGLQAIAAFTRPTGSGPTELPLQGAELFALALGLQAAIEAYDYKQDPQYLQLAVSLAKQGLPFIYMYTIPERDHSVYGAVPAFSATNWREGWFGRIVQWTGLVYSEALLRLAPHDQSLDWNKLAQGIMNEAAREVDTGRAVGRFPDSVEVAEDKEKMVQNIWPEWLLTNLQYESGVSPHWDSKEGETVRAVSGISIDALTEGDTVKIQLRGPAKGISYTMIETERSFSKVKVNGVEVALMAASLTEVADGYRLGKEFTGYIIKHTHTGENVTIELASADDEPTPVQAGGLTVSASGTTPAANESRTKISTVEAVEAGSKLVYKNYLDTAVTVPNVGDTLSGYADLPTDGIIKAANGDKIAVAEVDGLGKVLRFGQTTAVVAAEPPYPATTNTMQQVDVIVNGKVQSGGTATTTVRNKRTVTTFVVDQKKLEDLLAKEDQSAVVSLLMNTDSDVLAFELNGNLLKTLKDKQTMLEFKTKQAAYKLSADQLNIGAIVEQLGNPAALLDVKLVIEIAVATADMAKTAEDAAKKKSFELVVPPISFTIKGTYGDTSIEIAQFDAYVERTIAIPEGIDQGKLTTGVAIEPDGTIRHVPTKFIAVDGQYFAQINSLTNSTYSVIWHPLQFQDAQMHWAKAAVHEMGSRMVVNGVGAGLYDPNRDITRAEFAAIVVRALGLKIENDATPFTDVKQSDWYSGAIRMAYAYELINGFSDGSFRPTDKITREQAMVIIAKAMNITKLKEKLPIKSADQLLGTFRDRAQVSNWAQTSVADCVQAGIVSGRSNGELAPKDHITRAEVAVIAKKLLQQSGLI